MKKHNGKLLIEKGTSTQALQEVAEAQLEEARMIKREERKQQFLEDQRMLALQTVLEGVESGLFRSAHEGISKVASMKTADGKPVFYVGYLTLCQRYDAWLKALDVRVRVHWLQKHDLKTLERQMYSEVEPSKREFPPQEDAPRPDTGMSPYSHSCVDYEDPDQD